MSQNSSDTQETSKVGFIFHVDIRHKPKYVEADLLELHKLLYEKIDLDNEINKDLIENYIAKLKYFKKMEHLADKITITEKENPKLKSKKLKIIQEVFDDPEVQETALLFSNFTKRAECFLLNIDEIIKSLQAALDLLDRQSRSKGEVMREERLLSLKENGSNRRKNTV